MKRSLSNKIWNSLEQHSLSMVHSNKAYSFLMLLLVFLLILLPIQSLAFFPMSWSDLNYQMRYQAKWYRIRLENRVEVFDPFDTRLPPSGKLIPKLMPERSYVQIIHWKRDQVLVIETRDDEGRLMHLYYEYQEQSLEKHIDPIRYFNLNEVMPHFLRFLAKKPENREKALREFNIEDFLVSQTWHENQIHYQIGIQGSDHYALIDPKTFLLQSLHSSIYRADGTKWKLKVQFSQFKNFQRQKFPQLTEYFLDGKLFKRVSLVKAKKLSRLPIKELKEMAMARVEHHFATWTIDYAR